jgi:hypothetical protein
MTSTAYVRGENPLRADKLNTDFGRCIDRAGDTMTGRFTLAYTPTGALEAATKGYVDTAVSYVPNISEAPSDGTTYGRLNAAWTRVLPLTGGTIAGNLIATGGIDNTVIGATTPAAVNSTAMNYKGAAGTLRAASYFSGTQQRWQIGVSGAAESGANAGSDWFMNRFNDAGSYLATPLSISRATGLVVMTSGATIIGGSSDSHVIGATTPAAGTFTTAALTAQATDIAMNNHRISGVLSPIAATDVATKQYVDTANPLPAVPVDTSLDLNFLSGMLDSRITFTRASTATYFDATGTMQTALSNVARFDYDPVTHAPLGLLIEEARTNLVLNGNAAAPTSGGATIASSTDLSPLYAPATIYKHTITGALNRGVVAVSGLTAATTYQFYFYAYIPVTNTTTTTNLLYNNAGEGGTGTQQPPAADGYDMARKGIWQRLVMQYITGPSETSANFVIRGLLTGDVFYTALYQVEAGTFPTSYIPTAGAAVARAADVATMPLPPGFSGTLGSWAADFTVEGFRAGFFGRIVAGSNNQVAPIYVTDVGRGGTYDGAVTLTTANAFAVNTLAMIASAITGTAGTVCLNGGAIVSGSLTSGFGAITSIKLMGDASVSETSNGRIRRVRYWPRALTNSELQAATVAQTTTGMTIDGSPIGLTVPAPGAFTTLAAQGPLGGVLGGAVSNVGRNMVHNGLFNVQQRGAGPWSANGNYTADRWSLSLAGSTASISIQTTNNAARGQIGDEEAIVYMTTNFTGTAGASDYARVTQPIENVRRLGGKTVTVSFTAASSGTLNLGVSLDQYFGTGGSPSATVFGIGKSVSVGLTFVRYSLTFQLATTNFLTFGTNNDHYTRLNFWFSSGATSAPAAGNVGVQTGVINLWGVQVEVGNNATPLEKIEYGDDLRHCQRFYQTFVGLTSSGYNATGTIVYNSFMLPVTMRAAPAVTIAGASYSNASGLATGTVNTSMMQTQLTITTGPGYGWGQASYGLVADL